MTENLQLIWIILGMFSVTYPVRFIPLFIFNRITIPQWTKIWLSYVPLALFSAFVTQIYFDFISKNTLFFGKIPMIIAGLLTLGITVKTRSLGVGMGIGFGIFVILTSIL